MNYLLLGSLQGWLDAGLISDFEALGMILKLLGYKIRDNGNGSYDVWVDDGSTVTMKVDNTISAYGRTDPKGNMLFNFARSGNVADMALVILHEVCHAVLKGTYGDHIDADFEHKITYYVEWSYLTALDRSHVYEFSGGFKVHVVGELYNRGTSGLRQIPLTKIAEKWLRRARAC